jgi:hypothetical protein
MLRFQGSRFWRCVADGGLLAIAASAACGVDERTFGGAGGSCVVSATCTAQPGPAGGAGGAGQTLGGGGASSAAGGGAGENERGNAGSGGDDGVTAGTGGIAGTAGSGSGGIAGTAGTGGGAGAAPGTFACSTELLVNGGFEAGSEPWISFTTGQDPLIYDSTGDGYDGVTPRGGQRLGWLGGVPSEVNRLSQTVSLPAGASAVTFSGALRIQIFEEHALVDFLRVSLVSDGQRLAVLEFDNGDATVDWFDFTGPVVDVTAYAGRGLTLEFESEIGAGPGTNFYMDDLTLVSECAPE